MSGTFDKLDFCYVEELFIQIIFTNKCNYFLNCVF